MIINNNIPKTLTIEHAKFDSLRGPYRIVSNFRYFYISRKKISVLFFDDFTNNENYVKHFPDELSGIVCEKCDNVLNEENGNLIITDEKYCLIVCYKCVINLGKLWVHDALKKEFNKVLWEVTEIE